MATPPLRETVSSASDTAAVIAGYEPVGIEAAVWEAVGDEVRCWVVAANPGHRRRALQLLYASAHLAAWCHSQGVPILPATALRDTTIERFCAWAESRERFSRTTRATIRARLRHLAAANAVPGNRASPPSLARGRVRPPYSDEEAAAYLHLARNQHDPDRQRRLLGLLAAGLGAGCAPEDLRDLRGSDVRSCEGATWVTVRGPRPRQVPVLARYAEPLRWAAQRSGPALLVGGWKPDRRSITTALLHRIDGGADLAPIEPGRLRSTWLTTHLRHGVRLDVLMAAAGLRTPTTIVDLVRLLPPAPDEAWTALLEGET